MILSKKNRLKFKEVKRVRAIGNLINGIRLKLKRYEENSKIIPYKFIHKTAQLELIDLIDVKTNAEIKDYVIIKTYRNPVVIGKNTQINPFCVIYGGSGGVYIGDNVMIAPHCMIASGIHDYKQKEVPMRFAGNLTKGPIIIKDDVWIGANCTIGDGITIGEGAVVSANSFVNKDVEPYTIVGGVPAKKIGTR